MEAPVLLLVCQCGTATLPKVGMITHAGHAVHTLYHKFQVIIYMQKKSGYLPGQEVNRLDVLP
jgi:hypothetical protein